MNLKMRRIMLGMTQASLADKLGVGQSAVHLWESGKTYPRIETLKNLASLFGCSVDELLQDQTKDNNKAVR